jgi:hypothetical protein
MGFHPDRQQDLFKPPSESGVAGRRPDELRPLLLALLTEAVGKRDGRRDGGDR